MTLESTLAVSWSLHLSGSTPTPETELVVQLNQGWTWISLNVEAADMQLSTVLGGIALQGGDHVKNQQSFTDYYQGFGFFGQLLTMTTGEMYALQLASASTLRFRGTPTPLPKTISLASGWTFLPCPYQGSVSLSDGAPVFGYAQGDMLKSQALFAEFYAGFGFYGTLTMLEPGFGYKAKVSVGGIGTFQSSRR